MFQKIQYLCKRPIVLKISLAIYLAGLLYLLIYIAWQHALVVLLCYIGFLLLQAWATYMNFQMDKANDRERWVARWRAHLHH